MAEKISKTVNCPQCAYAVSTELLCSVNRNVMEDMRDAVMEDRFFQWKCPQCGYETQLLHPLLYNDVRNQFMIYYIPHTQRRSVADEKLENEYAELSDVRKRVVPRVNALKEKIVLLEKGINDMAMELAKLAVARVVEKSTGQTVQEGYFLTMNREENTVSFQFFLGSEKRPYLQTTRLEVYDRSLSIVQQYFPDEARKKGFLNVDAVWARDALQRYKNAK